MKTGTLCEFGIANKYYMPLIPISDAQSLNETVGGLPYWDVCVEASQFIREILFLLDHDLQIPGALVLDQKKLVGLIPRDQIYEKLGRPFGVELFLKNSSKEFYEMLGIKTLILPFDTLIDDAVKMALMRDERSLYEPIVVSHANGFGIISMHSLLMAQQETLRGLYSEVRNISITDPLTLVNNRRGFFEVVNKELEVMRKFDLEFAVLMIDIDNFKGVNDRYGHLVGDEVIKSVAGQIFANIQKRGTMGRFGGEEFVIFLREVSSKEAYNLAELLCKNIAGFFHTINGYQIRVTISIGMSFSKGTSHTLDQLFTQADDALYFAKNTGRNKMIEWKETLSNLQKEKRAFRIAKGEPERETKQILDQTLHGLLRMLYLRDYETEAHTARVTKLTLDLAKKVGVSEEECENIQIGSLLHDIGKIAVPDNILFKKGDLTEAEWAIMRKHPEYAYSLLSPISYFQHALDIPYCHHEHWNGKGYPRGLYDSEIPLAARIFTIADIWDALSSDRPYRAAWKENEVMNYLVKQAGIIFDPDLVPLFLECLDDYSNKMLSK
jgi:diguanylate cyclase (GGDEF)-like protein